MVTMSPGFAATVIGLFQEVPLGITMAEVNMVSSYVPDLTYRVSPAERVLTPFAMVRSGCEFVPGFESLPLVAT